MQHKITEFHKGFPDARYLDLNHLDGLNDFLMEIKVLAPGETIVSTERPGEGNMNFVLRALTDERSFIIKQCRPWVEKYPDIDAPVERQYVETRYYEIIHNDALLSSYSPAIIKYVPINLLLVLEDLGEGSDFTFLYERSKTMHQQTGKALVNYLSHLHNTAWDISQFPTNKELRLLNHAHIFSLPFDEENGFDLDAIQYGLQDLSLEIKRNDALKKVVSRLGGLYLGEGKTLIHGDYYPGSWLKVEGGVKVIDPEFSHVGFAEFDLGVFVAHLMMSATSREQIDTLLSQYEQPGDFDTELFLGFCGTELLRRIFGLAQLPLELTLEEKRNLMEVALDMILQPQNISEHIL